MVLPIPATVLHHYSEQSDQPSSGPPAGAAITLSEFAEGDPIQAMLGSACYAILCNETSHCVVPLSGSSGSSGVAQDLPRCRRTAPCLHIGNDATC